MAEIGLTKADAEALADGVRSALDEAHAGGAIDDGQLDVLREAWLKPTGSTGDVQARALPVWAAAAIVGCAATVITGSGKTQVANLIKDGKTDEAKDVAIDIAVDCVFGAVPGGAIGAALKKTLTKPIREALDEPVEKVIKEIEDE